MAAKRSYNILLEWLGSFLRFFVHKPGSAGARLLILHLSLDDGSYMSVVYALRLAFKKPFALGPASRSRAARQLLIRSLAGCPFVSRLHVAHSFVAGTLLLFCLALLFPSGSVRACEGPLALAQLSPAQQAQAKLLNLCKEGSSQELSEALKVNALMHGLLEKNADLDKKDLTFPHKHPLNLAVQHKPDPELAGVLLASLKDFAIKELSRDASLLSAVRAGRDDLVKRQIRRGADVNAVESDNTSALHIAARNDAEAFKLLYHAGANIYAVNDEGKSVLHYAARASSTEPLILLLQAGLDPNILDKKGNSPLHEYMENPEIITLLVAAGAELERENDWHHTPIEAVHRSEADIKAFLQAGVELVGRDAWGRVKVRGFSDGNTYLSRCRFFRASEVQYYGAEGRLNYVQQAALKMLNLEEAQAADSAGFLENSLQFSFVSNTDGQGVDKYKYYMLSESGAGVFGVTTEEGNTVRVYTREAENIDCYGMENARDKAFTDISFSAYREVPYDEPLPELSEIKYGERICFVNPESSLTVAGYPYFVLSAEGYAMAGRTDEYGCSQEFFIPREDNGTQFEVYGGTAALEMNNKETH